MKNLISTSVYIICVSCLSIGCGGAVFGSLNVSGNADAPIVELVDGPSRGQSRTVSLSLTQYGPQCETIEVISADQAVIQRRGASWLLTDPSSAVLSGVLVSGCSYHLQVAGHETTVDLEFSVGESGALE